MINQCNWPVLAYGLLKRVREWKISVDEANEILNIYNLTI
jgi:hypothetical protein